MTISQTLEALANDALAMKMLNPASNYPTKKYSATVDQATTASSAPKHVRFLCISTINALVMVELHSRINIYINK